MRFVSGFLFTLVLTQFAGCQSAPAPETTVADDTDYAVQHTGAAERKRSIYVASNGWHTGIILARVDLADGFVPEADDFPEAQFFEFSWGDAKYFPSPEKGLGVVMSALFTPTPAVMHLAGLPAHPRIVFPSAETVVLEVTQEGFQNLVSYLDDAFDRSASASSKPGLYPFSRFYPAKGRFHMFNTCNTWTAAGLAAAGITVTVTGTLQAEELMKQLRQ